MATTSALLTNNASATLAAGIISTDTSLTVNTGQGALFPNPGASEYFYATLTDGGATVEIVKCTARSTDTLTIVRAQDGTTAQSFSTGDIVELRPIAELFREKVDKAGDTMTGTLRVPKLEVDSADFYLDEAVAGFPRVNFHTDDHLAFDRTNNEFEFTIGGIIRQRFDATGFLRNKVGDNAEGLVNSGLLYKRNTALVGSNVNTLQTLFGVGIPLKASTVYLIEASFFLTKTAGTNAHTTNLQLVASGGLTANDVMVFQEYATENANPVTDVNIQRTMHTAFGVSRQLSASTTNATNSISATLRGIIDVNVAGTLTPQYILSSAPGGAYTLQPGSFIRLVPLGASGAIINYGGWV